jgi:hypothetical protein
MPRHTPLHLRLHGLPQQQPHLLVLEAPEHHLVQARRLSTVPLPTVWLRRAGYANYSRSSTALSHGVHWSTTTTSVPCTSPPTPSSISAQSTSRSIFTSCASASPSVMFEFFMFRQRHSSPISSLKVFLHRCSQSFGPVSTSIVARISTAGGGGLELYFSLCTQDPCWACVPSCVWACALL